MRRAGAAVAAALALCMPLSACARGGSGAAGDLRGQTWQVVALHTDPDAPDELPADAAGKASLRFSRDSLIATTGCAPLRAGVDFDGQDGRIKLSEVEVGDAADCMGGSRYVHDTLTALFVPGAAFDVRMLGDREATLTVVTDGVNRPAIRVMAL